MWQAEFARLCKEYQVEPVFTDDEVILLVPEIPEETIKAKFHDILPGNVKHSFREGPRIATTESLRTLLENTWVSSASLEIEGHLLTLSIASDSPVYSEKGSPVWAFIKDLLCHDPFVKGWKILVNGHVMMTYDCVVAEIIARQVIPNRQTDLTNDDVMDIRIALETLNVHDFINSI